MSIFRRLASGGEKPSTASVDSDNPTQFTLPHLRNLHKVLVENKEVTSENESLVVEVLRVLAEMVVYGDSKSELLFDFFCEKNMLSLFLEIMRGEHCPGKVYVQILQTLSILCQCVRNSTSLYYLLSNNYINDIIRFSYDFETEELSDIFLSFMKSLSLRLNKQTVQFFFIEETATFPLLSRAIEFLQYQDPMVRTGAQATILNILKIQDAKARKYSLSDNILLSFVSEVTRQLEILYRSILENALEYATCVVQQRAKTLKDRKIFDKIENQMRSAVDALEDWLYYLEDIYGLKIPKVTNLLVDGITAQYVYPVLLKPLLRRRPWSSSSLFSPGSSGSSKPHRLSKSSRSGDSDLDVSSVMEAAKPIDSNLLTISEALRLDKGMSEGEAIGGEEDNEGGQDIEAVELVVSLHLLAQMFRTVKEKRLRRSVSVALFHPCSRQHRLAFLTERKRAQSPGGDVVPSASSPTPLDHSRETARPIATETVNRMQSELEGVDKLFPYKGDSVCHTSVECESEHEPSNPYRLALLDLLTSGKDRFTMLACLLIEACVRLDISSCSYFLQTASGSVDDTAVLGGVLDVLETLRIWDVDDSSRRTPEVDVEVMLADLRVAEPPVPSLRQREDRSSPDRGRNGVMEALEAERGAEGGEVGEEEEAVGGGDDGARKNYQEEMDEYTYGSAETGQLASRDRGGSLDLVQSEFVHADAMAMCDLLALARNDVAADCVLTEGGPASRGIVTGLLYILNNALTQSLAVLQTAAVVVYDLCRLYHGATCRTSDWHCPGKIIACLEHIREATKRAAAALLERANGWLSDTLLSQLEEELDRAAASDPIWENIIKRVSADVLLLLPPTPHLFQRIGMDHSLPTSEVANARREIQAFLLLRSLYMCILKLASAPTTPTSSGDIAQCVVDSSLSQFTEYADVSDKYTVGKPITMGGRHCFASCVLVPTFDPAEFARTGSIVHNTSAPPSRQASPAGGHSSRAKTPGSRSPKKPLSLVRRLSLTPPAPVDTGNDTALKTPERPRKVGEVYFIYDELKTLLLSVPFKRLDSGVVLLAVPIHKIDVATDSEDDRNIKLLMRSTHPLPTMDRVTLSDPTGSSSSHSPLSTYGDSGPKLATILPIRTPGVLYQMVIGFESKKHCDAAVKHIETCRTRVKLMRMDMLKGILQQWAVRESTDPNA